MPHDHRMCFYHIIIASLVLATLHFPPDDVGMRHTNAGFEEVVHGATTVPFLRPLLLLSPDTEIR